MKIIVPEVFTLKTNRGVGVGSKETLITFQVKYGSQLVPLWLQKMKHTISAALWKRGPEKHCFSVCDAESQVLRWRIQQGWKGIREVS